MTKKIELCKSIVEEQIFQEFEEQRSTNLFNHSANSNFIDDFISAAYVLCPDFIDVNGYIFVADFFDATGEEALKKLQRLEIQHNHDKKMVEQWVNSWSFGDFFLGKTCKSMNNEKILMQFGDILVYYWSRRLRELFPNRNLVVEYGENIMGEYGPTITLYENV